MENLKKKHEKSDSTGDEENERYITGKELEDAMKKIRIGKTAGNKIILPIYKSAAFIWV